MAAVSLTVGLGLFLLPPYGQMPLAHQIVLAAIALALWSFSYGIRLIGTSPRALGPADPSWRTDQPDLV